ncbi:MBL fold metallo-hydrolase [Salaquimonas pukyongi]|uniref:MBL fold metallo-hydrolase n=1 Tax=Salaquimonas pukyongi TaxID=2712698 RepID=UPI00096B8BC5|nr:MBL fold metallo-hydrolase [Salaquimonas pukyongi]
MSSLPFRAEFEPRYGEAVPVDDGIERITAPNRGAFTFHGTNTYLVGDKEVMVIDPGPDEDNGHYKTILNAVRGRTVSHVIVTHTHVDHSPLARRLARETGAPLLGEGPHRPARDLHLGEINALDASGDKEFEPDIVLSHGDVIKGDVIEGHQIALEAVFTPGHTVNHMAFALKDSPYLFSGDHVMAWATSIVAPPDGNMVQYMQSLDRLLEHEQTVYLPGHGGRLNRAHEFVRGLRAHRRMRETAILHRIRAGDETIPEMVGVIYKETDKRLHGAAALSVFAHIEDLLHQGRVVCDSTPSLAARYFPA